VRKAFVFVAVVILIVPIFGLLVSASVGARLAAEDDRSYAPACDPREALSFEGPRSMDRAEVRCYQQAATSVLWKASASLLGLTLLVPISFAGLAFTLGRRRQWLARCFPWIVRPTMLGLAGLLVLHGLLLFYAGQQLTIATDYFGPFILSGLIGLGFVGAAVLILLEAMRLRKPEPLRVTGLAVGPDRVPGLIAQIARVATRLGVRVPARIIVGMDVRAFVTRIPISLRGVEVLSAGETLYLPACALRILDDKQLEALLAHELAHFRGKDVAFTERFIPSFLTLRNAIETLTPDNSPAAWWSVLPKLPALLLMQSIAVVMAVAVARIRRARELEADRVGAEIESPEAFARALVKFSLLMILWQPFRAANARYLATGRARSNICSDFIESSRLLLATAEGDHLRGVVLSSRLKHPTDVHPPLADRIRALGLDPDLVLDESLSELAPPTNMSTQSGELETAITALENDWMSIPGTPVALDTADTLPDALRLRLKRPAVVAQR